MERPIAFYQTYPEYPLFCPMYKPLEMKEMGIFKGEKGFYKAHPKHELIHSKVDENWSPFLWYDWYEDFNDGRRNFYDDKFFITEWMGYTLYLYDSIIIPDPPRIEIPDSMKQTLLEVGCNYKYPLLHTKWTIQKLKGNL